MVAPLGLRQQALFGSVQQSPLALAESVAVRQARQETEPLVDSTHTRKSHTALHQPLQVRLVLVAALVPRKLLAHSELQLLVGLAVVVALGAAPLRPHLLLAHLEAATMEVAAVVRHAQSGEEQQR
jgi:hypothetical protein